MPFRLDIAVALLGPFNFGKHKNVSGCHPESSVSSTGLAMSIMNTMLEAISDDLGIEENVGGAVAAAALYAGAVIGGFVVGPFEKCCGRFVQFWIAFLYLLASLLCGLTTDHKICWGGPFDGCVPYMLLFGRVISGVAFGFSIVISPKWSERKFKARQ